MSGGVDSSVAAALLSAQGGSASGGKKYRVVGVYFKPWSPNHATCSMNHVSGKADHNAACSMLHAPCQWQQDRLDAMRVATKLGIEFKTWDFSKEYGKEVAEYMIRGYRAGITPNPDVMCNKEIKFGIFLKKALAEGADYIATGHYARIHEARNMKHGTTKQFKLLKGIDTNKDQSYFLWTLTQDQLKHSLFPIGEYTKPKVRAMAKKFGLPTFDKKDSQGVCFVGELNMKDFLEEYIRPKPGDIILKESGDKIGKHDGFYYYTIGQRHGLDIKTGGGPYYVVAKDVRKNIIYVATTNEKPIAQSAKLKNVHWITGQPKLPMNLAVQIRYRSPLVSARIELYASRFTLYARQPLEAVAEGQSAVFYRGAEVLGGGILM